ncbi:hypothetical protein BMJ22_15610 [Sinorhizobium medicae]|nr:hypothetical protein BMJ22_15610 [Sinorhizobium medicae]
MKRLWLVLPPVPPLQIPIHVWARAGDIPIAAASTAMASVEAFTDLTFFLRSKLRAALNA